MKQPTFQIVREVKSNGELVELEIIKIATRCGPSSHIIMPKSLIDKIIAVIIEGKTIYKKVTKIGDSGHILLPDTFLNKKIRVFYSKDDKKAEENVKPNNFRLKKYSRKKVNNGNTNKS